jgi:hypothetical protein
MKKLLIILFFLALARVYAQTVHPCCCACPCPCQKNRIYIGANAYYQRLSVHQPEEGSIIPSGAIDGTMGGVVAGYEYKRIRHLYAAIRGFYGQGKLDNALSYRYIHELDAQTRLGFNYMALQGPNVVVSFYTGFGFTFKNQFLDNLGPSTFKLRYYKYYIPVGLLLDLRVTDCFYFRFDFTWVPDVDPTVESSNFSKIRCELKHKQNFRVELPLVFLFGCKKQWEINLVPFWRRDKDGRTKKAAICDEFMMLPEQVYSYWGATLNFAYRF